MEHTNGRSRYSDEGEGGRENSDVTRGADMTQAPQPCCTAAYDAVGIPLAKKTSSSGGTSGGCILAQLLMESSSDPDSTEEMVADCFQVWS